MKTLTFLTIALFCCGGPALGQDVQWRQDFMLAKREAKETKKPILLDVGTANCLWCQKLDTLTFRDPAVVRLLAERFVVVKIAADKEAELAQALDVRSYPTLIFARPDGKILGMHEGFVDADRLNRQLHRALEESGGQTVARTTVYPR
jgi:uncharacterized protein YyaL (SSP411 family)